MSIEKILKLDTQRQRGNFFRSLSDDFKDSVDSIIETEPCPNCSTDMVNNKCLGCGYGLGEEYFQYLSEKKSLATPIKKPANKFVLKTIAGDSFFVFGDSCIISDSSADLMVEINGEKIKFSTTFSYLKKEDSFTIYNIKFSSIPKVNINGKWKNKYIDFKYLKKFVFSILTDSRFGPFHNQK